MKRIGLPLLLSSGFLMTACQNHGAFDQVISQKYVHKYGFDVSAEEWDERYQDGLVIEDLKNGVRITRCYENGKLHGTTSHTFPNSPVVEKALVYAQGNLLKETLYDPQGMPIREDLYEFEDRHMITLWSDHGVPLSIEEYENEILINGSYYTTEHELEARVEGGYGYRMRRTRDGDIISRDQMQNGLIAQRTTYHPNGEIHTVSNYSDYQLHGPQFKFTAQGRPLMELSWNHGILDGTKVIYRNGLRVAEIPYEQGQKQGIETHYDDLGNMISQTLWKDDKKHGCCKSFTEESVDSDWFFQGMLVDKDRFDLLEQREQIIAEFSIERSN